MARESGNWSVYGILGVRRVVLRTQEDRRSGLRFSSRTNKIDKGTELAGMRESYGQSASSGWETNVVVGVGHTRYSVCRISDFINRNFPLGATNFA